MDDSWAGDGSSAVLHDLTQHRDALALFWRSRAVDHQHGGFVTSFDEAGVAIPETEKYLLSQTRLIWCFSELGASLADDDLVAIAGEGVDFLSVKFLDREAGGWFWKIGIDGRVLDPAKLIYGQSFALYALAAYARVSGSSAALDLASDTFDAIQEHAFDSEHGGYLENLDEHWAPMPESSGGVDRKSLDIHLHLLESFTELVLLTEDPVHVRRLREVRDVIVTHMIDRASGAGGNQYDIRFTPLPPVVIDRTWIAERVPPGERRPPAVTTSYGHNLELGWLLTRADSVLGLPVQARASLVRGFADHALAYGYDHEHGGIYREGPYRGPATDTDKEFWQNSEALVGFLDAFVELGDPQYFQAFLGTWAFAQSHLIHPAGEWRMRTTDAGVVVDGNLGNHWTGGYHTVRAALESVRRLRLIDATG
jgi:mannobiose 2-epimerase